MIDGKSSPNNALTPRVRKFLYSQVPGTKNFYSLNPQGQRIFILSPPWTKNCYSLTPQEQRIVILSPPRDKEYYCRFLTPRVIRSSSSLFGWSIRPRNNNFHPSRSLATCSTTFQLVHPSSFRSLSMVLLHVVFGLPCLLLPSGVQVRATLQLLSFSLNT